METAQDHSSWYSAVDLYRPMMMMMMTLIIVYLLMFKVRLKVFVFQKASTLTRYETN